MNPEIPLERKKEIVNYMTAHLWVAEYALKSRMWIMSKEPYAYSNGPFKVLAMASTLEEAFDKAKSKEE